MSIGPEKLKLFRELATWAPTLVWAKKPSSFAAECRGGKLRIDALMMYFGGVFIWRENLPSSEQAVFDQILEDAQEQVAGCLVAELSAARDGWQGGAA